MKRHPTTRLNSPRAGVSRSGFTLLELLVAVGIIALLVGLSFPVLSSMRTNARIVEVKADIDSLSDALEVFKAKFGEYPPSRITLYSSSAGWDARSQAILRKYWPKFDFSSGGGCPWTGRVHLDGAECLTFFLGGVRDSDGSYIGFSNNPERPFSRTPRDSRIGPFFRFPQDRLVDDDKDAPAGMEVGMEYLDPLPDQVKPYIYLSSYNGRGYNANDLDANGDLTDSTDRRMSAIYTEVGSKGWKPNTFQIISPGFDGEYGDGGAFDPDDVSNLSEADTDNITNFYGGMLGK